MKINQLDAGTDRNIVSCSVATSVAEAAQLLASKRIGAMPVMDGGRIAGIFSERDLLYSVAEHGAAVLDRPVDSVMTSPAITVGADTSVDDAMALMTRRRIRHLPVCDGDRLLGFVSIGDLVKSRMDEIAGEAQAMREYIATA